MNKTRRLIYLFIFLIALIGIKYLLVDKAFFNLPKDSDLWYVSGLLLIILGIFLSETYFTQSVDVIVNLISLLIALCFVDSFKTFVFFPLLVVYSIVIGCFALASFLLIDKSKDPQCRSQQLARVFNSISTHFGSSKVLFSIVFLMSFVNYFVYSLISAKTIEKQQIAAMSLILFWGVAILIEPIDRKVIQPLIKFCKHTKNAKSLGVIRERHLPNILVMEILDSSTVVPTGELVVIDHYNFMGQDDDLTVGFLLDTFESDQKRFVNIAVIREGKKYKELDANCVFLAEGHLKSKIETLVSDSSTFTNKDNLIGLVSENSDIDLIKIKMLPGIDIKKMLKEGDLLSVDCYKSPTKYQIINVHTISESVEGGSRKGGKIITAQQIGYWKTEEDGKVVHKFFNSNWVPDLNTLVFIENQGQKPIDSMTGNYYKVGVIPKSPYPVYINFDEAIAHHLAIIGKTGTGKSYMAARMMEKMVECGYKIVILEVDQNNPQSLSKYIKQDLIASKKWEWKAQDVKRKDGYKDVTVQVWTTEFEFNDSKNIYVVNWESGQKDKTGGPLNLTDGAEAVIGRVIAHQAKNPTDKICLVLEEAYDFVPESTFGKQDFGQPNVSRISQLVLKCRKHNVGFLIITQRTALVTKTILYQCHTIIALQSFDETSKNFMGSYIDNKYLESMSILPRYRAIVVGKGSSCDRPVIVDFFNKEAIVPNIANPIP